jgi:hypothetical protein
VTRGYAISAPRPEPWPVRPAQRRHAVSRNRQLLGKPSRRALRGPRRTGSAPRPGPRDDRSGAAAAQPGAADSSRCAAGVQQRSTGQLVVCQLGGDRIGVRPGPGVTEGYDGAAGGGAQVASFSASRAAGSGSASHARSRTRPACVPGRRPAPAGRRSRRRPVLRRRCPRHPGPARDQMGRSRAGPGLRLSAGC